MMKDKTSVETNTGTINADGTVTGNDGKTYQLPTREIGDDGHISVLIDATSVGGNGSFRRQSVMPYVGMNTRFLVSSVGYGFNYSVLKPMDSTEDAI